MAIIRTTSWHDDRDNLVQIAVAVLDDDWEPAYEETRPVGPFDDHQAVIEDMITLARTRAWRCWQQRLALP